MSRAIPLPSGKKSTAPQATTAPMAMKIPAAPAVPKIEEAPATTKTAEEPAVSTTRDPAPVASVTTLEAAPPAASVTKVEAAPPAASVTKIEVAPPTSPLGAMIEAPVALVPTPAPMMTPAALARAVVAPVPVTPVAAANPFQAAPERSPFPTVADEVDIEMTGDVPAPPPAIAQPSTAPLVVPAVVASLPPTNATLASPLLALPPRAPMVSLPDPSPSKEALLERAAALGPMRMTWTSFVPTNDPVLEAKMKPEVADRRARLQKVVKGTLAVCGAMCFVALIVTLVSGGESTAKAASRSEGATKTAPTKTDSSLTKLAGVTRTKAVRTAAPAVTTAVAPRPRRR